MGPRRVFGLSLLAACGIHAAVLLLPRAPFMPPTPTTVPAVEIELTEVQDRVAPVRAPAASVAPVRPVAPVAKQPAPAAGVTPARVDSEEPRPVAPAAQPAPDLPSPDLLLHVPAAPASPASASSAGRPDASAAMAPGSAEPSPQSVTAVLVPPRPRAPIRPSYPHDARSAGIEGVVKLFVTVDPRGEVTAAEILASSGSALLDNAALDAVRQALFAPATENGRAVACRVIVPIRFRLAPY